MTSLTLILVRCGLSVEGSPEMHDVTYVFAQCSSSSFDMHQDSLEKGKNNNNINNGKDVLFFFLCALFFSGYMKSLKLSK